jgi:hypothetical protein
MKDLCEFNFVVPHCCFTPNLPLIAVINCAKTLATNIMVNTKFQFSTNRWLSTVHNYTNTELHMMICLAGPTEDVVKLAYAAKRELQWMIREQAIYFIEGLPINFNNCSSRYEGATYLLHDLYVFKEVLSFLFYKTI